MSVQNPRRLVVLIAVATLALVLVSCGSKLDAAPGSPTSFNAGTPAAGTPPAQLTGQALQGYQLFQEFKCAICHSLDGQVIVGPPLNGLYGSKVYLSNGKTVIADESYLKLAILEPDSQIVNGFPSGIMSGHIMEYQSKIAQGNNLDALIAFIKSQS